MNSSLSGWAAERAIALTTTEGHDPSGNGQAESFIGKVKARARAMLAMCSLGTEYWTFVVEHVALCTRLKAHEREIPTMPIFGQEVFARIKDPEDNDFMPRAVRSTFLGLASGVADGKAVLYPNMVSLM